MLDRQETHHIIDQDRDSIIDWGKKEDVEDNIHINPHDQEEIVYTLLMDKGKNSFQVEIGTKDQKQSVRVNLTSSFDGFALPSFDVSPLDGTNYEPKDSYTHEWVEQDDDIKKPPQETNNSLIIIDNTIFSHKKLQNYITIYANHQKLNSSMQMYFLNNVVESSGFQLYKGGGYMGITPSSWQSEMGIFHMFRH